MRRLGRLRSGGQQAVAGLRIVAVAQRWVHSGADARAGAGHGDGAEGCEVIVQFDYRFYEQLEPKDRAYIRRRVVGRAINYYVFLVRNKRRVRKILNAASGRGRQYRSW
jgi:hypothetical protein